MNLDERWTYRFIRTDLPFKQHSIQAGHAASRCGVKFGAKHGGDHPGIAFLIDVGMPDMKSLARVVRKLDAAGIEYLLHTDTDISPEPSALCTFPVDAVQRNKYFSSYRLYDPTSFAVVAQMPQEHSPCKGEVARPASSQRLQSLEPKETELLKP